MATTDGNDDLNDGEIEVIEIDENNEGDGMDDEQPLEDEDLDGAAVTEFIPDDADVVFTKHTGSVFCCDLESTASQLAVTGGEDDRAFVWNITTGERVFECTGHKDSVTCASFSHDGMYVASGDMSGLIKAWNVASASEVWSAETSDLSWLEWHHSSHILLAGTIDGDLWMWRIPGNECKTFLTHGVQTDCGRILPDGKRAVVGYEDGSVKIWDLKTGGSLHHIRGNDAHKGLVTALDCHTDNVIVMTGSMDCTAKLINTQTGKVLSTLVCDLKEAGETQNSIESLAFCQSQPLAAISTLKGYLAIWDVSTQIQRHTCKQEAGIVKLTWDRSSPLVYTVGLDGVIRLWDARSGNLESHWTGHNGEILDMVLSRDGSTLITASDDKTSRVFHVTHPDR